MPPGRRPEIKPDQRAMTFFLDRSPDLLCIADADGYFRYLNPAWERTLGYTDQELRAKPYLEFVHPGDRDVTLAAGNKAASAEGVWLFENRYLHRDGSVVWLSWNSVFDDQTGLIFATARDVTQRIQAEEDRLRLHQNIAHDMAAPVSALHLYVVTKHSKGHMPDDVYDFLYRNVHRLERLIADARDVGRIHSGKLELVMTDVALADVINQAIGDLAAFALDRGVTVEVVHDPCRVHVDAGRLGQVMTNLLHNAIKFSPRGGRVQVTCTTDETHASVRVRDDGPGVPPADADRVFEPFLQLGNATAANEKGTGLGLYITRELVAAHGGSLCFEPVAQGALCTLKVPLAPAMESKEEGKR